MDVYTVEFRIEDPALIPADVTKLIGLQPSLTRDITTNSKSKRSRNPFWAYDGISSETNFVEQEWNSLEEGLLFLLDTLWPKRDLIKSQFSRYKMYWWCGCFQQSFDGGPTFSPKLLRKLADFGATLMIRNYRHEQET